MYQFEVEQILNARFLTKLIGRFRTKELPFYQKLERYYKVQNDAIMNRNMKQGKPNNKMVHGFARYITNMATSYFAGHPVEYVFEDGYEEYKELMSEYLTDGYNFDYELSKAASKKGISFELLYVDEGGSLKTKQYEAEEVIPIFSHKVSEYLNACIRLYEVRDIDNNLVCEYADVYDASRIYYYKRERGRAYYQHYETKPHYLSDVPFVVYQNNAEAMGDYVGVLSLIDSYDRAESNTANDMDYFTDAYLVVVGAGGGFTDEDGNELSDEQTEKGLRNSRIMYLDEHGDAKFLVKQTDSSSSEAYKTRMFRDIFFTSQVPPMTDESFAGDLSGTAIKYKLIGLEQLAIMKENQMRLAKMKKLKMLTDFLNWKKSKHFDVRVIKQKYTRNFIENLSESIDNAAKLTNIVSRQKQIEMLTPILVADAKEELMRIQKEQADGLYEESLEE